MAVLPLSDIYLTTPTVKKAEGRRQCGLLTHTALQATKSEILVGGLNPWLPPVAQRVRAFRGRWGPLWG